MKVRPISKRDWIETGWRVGIVVVVQMVSAPVLLPELLSLWMGLVVGMVGWLVRWHARTFAFRCPRCRAAFSISPWRDLITLHGLDRSGAWYYLPCPQCQIWSKCRIVKRI